MKYYTYCLTRPDKKDLFYPELDQPFWFGKGHGKRMYSHRQEAKKCLKDPTRFRDIKIKIIIKLWAIGLDFTEEKICMNITEQKSFEIEIEAIAKYGRIDNGTGCLANLTDGGEGSSGYRHSEKSKRKMSDNTIHTDEWKQMMSELHSGEGNPFHGRTHSEDSKLKISENHADMSGENSPNYGKHWPEDVRKRMSEGMKGKSPPNKGVPCSEEQKKKQSEAMKGKIPWMKGKQHDEKTKKQISESHKGIPLSEEHKTNIGKGHKGIVFSEERKNNISITLKNYWAKKKSERRRIDDNTEGSRH
jgi:hypothetical protein